MNQSVTKEWLLSSASGKVYQPLIKQSSYKSTLLACLNDIKTQTSRINEEATRCMQRRLLDMDQSITAQGEILASTNQSSEYSLQLLQDIYGLLVDSHAAAVPVAADSRQLEGGPASRKSIEPQKAEKSTYGK